MTESNSAAQAGGQSSPGSANLVPGNQGLWLLLALEMDIAKAAGGVVIWSRNEADQLASHLAADIREHLPGAERLLLTTAGALYDLCQLLRPGFPVLDALNRLRQAHVSNRGFSPQLLSMGAVDGALPAPELRPDPDLPPGPMSYLPIHLSGPEDSLKAVSERAESDLLDMGQVSAHTASWLQGAAGLPLQHAHLITFNDLQAMWRLQLEQIGLLPLWELLDHQLFSPSANKLLQVSSRHGVDFTADDQAVAAIFQTLDQQARHSDQSAEHCIRQYLNWTRDLRQYQAGLQAHSVILEWRGDALQMHPDFAVELKQNDREYNSENHILTDHHDPDQGLIVVSARGPVINANLYPLSPKGPNAIHHWIDEQYAEAGIRPPDIQQSALHLDGQRQLAAPPENARSQA